MEKNNKKSDYDFLTESIVNISKAGAYDVVSKQRDELVETLKQIKGKIRDEDIEAIRHKSIFSEFDTLLKQITDLIAQHHI